MACESFEECQIEDPLITLGPGERFNSLGAILAAAVNLVIYAFYAYFMIMVVYSLAAMIFALLSEQDNTKTITIFRKGLLDSVKYAFGMVLVLSANMILVWGLNLIGLTEAAELFNTFSFLSDT